MVQEILGRDAFAGFATEQRSDHAARLRGYALGNGKLATQDLGKERVVFRIVEGITENGEKIVVLGYV